MWVAPGLSDKGGSELSTPASLFSSYGCLTLLLLVFPARRTVPANVSQMDLSCCEGLFPQTMSQMDLSCHEGLFPQT